MTRKPLIYDSQLAEILDRLSDYYRDVHTAWVDDREPETLALWTIHAWLIRSGYEFNHTVYLYITSHDPDCGKTELARGIARVTPGAVICTPTVSRIIRFLTHPGNETLIIDQCQNLFRARSTDAEQLNHALSNGHTSGVSVLLTGKDGQEESYSTFYPKVFMGLATHMLNSEIDSRSISLRLVTANVTQFKELLSRQRAHKPSETGQAIAEAIRNWVCETTVITIAHMMDNDHTRTLNDGTELINREADIYQMLISIADMAGGKYPALIRDVAKEMSKGAVDPNPSESERLDTALLKLARDGRLPIENWLTGKAPIPAHTNGTYALENRDLGWGNGGSRPRPKNNGILPTITLVVNEGDKKAELRILVGDIAEIATALGVTRREFISAYERANRLHSQKGKPTIPLPFRQGGGTKTVIAVDFTGPVFGTEPASDSEWVTVWDGGKVN